MAVSRETAGVAGQGDGEKRAFPDHVTVLIVGAGPVGLALAAELGWRGISCLVIDQSDRAAEIPRTNAVGVRTMEYCRRWGIADAVREAGIPPDYPHTFMYVTSLAGHEIARFTRTSHGGSAPSPVSPERAQRCNQLWFDPILSRCAQSFPSVELRYWCRFESFEETRDGIRARLTDRRTGEPVEVAADYLVACCGGRSSIRGQLGIEVEGGAVLDHPVDIYFRAEELWAHHDKGKAAMHYIVGPEGVWANLEAQNGVDFWRVTLHGAQRPLDLQPDEVAAALQRAFGTEGVSYEIRAVTPWVRRALVARGYGGGRVFLAGDAAHQNPPDGGFGMNLGIGDAVDLGWKLEAMAKGWGGSHLLESYEIERRPVAERTVAAALKMIARRTLSPDPAICDDGADGERSRRKLKEEIDAIGTLFDADGVALGYRYEPSPIAWEDGTAAPPDDPTRYVPSARPGARAPHAWLGDGRSILDLFGRGFVLLRIGAEAPAGDAIAAAAKIRGVPFTAVSVDSPEIRTLYGRRLVLVRPDGHVAWRSDTLPPDPLALIDRVRGAGPAPSMP